MPLRTEWLDTQKTIACCTGEGSWTWDAYHATLEDIVNQFKSIHHRVDLVIAWTQDSITPKGSAMPHYQRAMRIMPPNVGMVVLVSNNTFARTIVSIFSKVYPHADKAKLVMVGSLAEAHSRIARDRMKQVATH